MFDPQRSLKLIQGALFDAEATWRAYLPESGDWQKTALLITLPVIVLALLIAYVLGILTSSFTMFGIRPTITVTVMNIVVSIIAVIVIAFIFSFFAGVFGGKNDFAKGFAAMSLAFVPAYAGQALSSIPLMGFLLLIGLAIYSLVLLWKIIPIYLEVPGDKRVGHFIVSLIAAIAANFVISAVLVGQRMSQVPDFAVQ